MNPTESHPRLEDQAFQRARWDASLRDRALRLLRSRNQGDYSTIARLLEWFLCPVTLWPADLRSCLEELMRCVEGGEGIPSQICVLIHLLPDLPDRRTREVFATHERDVEQGRYEHLVSASDAKFKAAEKQLSFDPAFKRDWRKITSTFDVARHADRKGIVRRTLVPERNLKAPTVQDWTKADVCFRAAFDAFCAKWNLYGVQHGKPLLLKLSVNLTPYGTMMFVPSYWSFDPKRDIRWGEVTKLHRARGQPRQGPTLAENAEQRRRDAIRLAVLDREVRRIGLRGAKRHEFLCSGLGWDPRTDPKRLSALRSKGRDTKKLMTPAKKGKPNYPVTKTCAKS